MQGLALQVQEQLNRDPHAGDLYIFRGRRGDLAKILWHDGVGLSLYGVTTRSVPTRTIRRNERRTLFPRLLITPLSPPGRSSRCAEVCR
ncbi:IS66 family insertion sequence element accessory protein TnpB [Rhodoblastus sp.]|uniref:IS66 family insertion sequence element accessory protein TnpB n=1 Tax=Rhodoblastus sp. TaxID=1962975 RepID=UPI003F98661D